MKWVICILISSSFLSFGQLQKDSLLTIWKNENLTDLVRISAMKTLAWDIYVNLNPDSALYFGNELFEFSKKRKNYHGARIGLTIQGAANINMGIYDQALDFFFKELDLTIKYGSKINLRESYNNLGVTFLNKRNFPMALSFFQKSLEISKELVDTNSLASSYMNLGVIYAEAGFIDTSYYYYELALEFSSPYKNPIGTADLLTNMAVHEVNSNNLDNQIQLFKKAIELRLMSDDMYGLSKTYNLYGIALSKSKMSDSAIVYFNRSLEICKNLDNDDLLVTAMSNIGATYIDKKEYNQALKYLLEADQILSDSEESFVEHYNVMENLYAVYKNQKNYKKALEYFESYQSLKDSSEKINNQKEFIRQEYKYEYEKKAAADSVEFAKEKEIAAVQLEKQDAELKAKRNQQYAMIGGLLLVGLFAGFMYNRFKVTRKQKGMIELAHEALEEKNQEILDSITYAKRIQSAILPPDKLFKNYLPKSFILYKPKDIVAGDFYWLETLNNQVMFAAADCTGHGVPGAMVSVICNNGLNRSVREHGLSNPADILNKTREIVIQEFEKSEEEVKDGMDIALVTLSKSKSSMTSLKYAGAHNPLWIIKKDATEIEEIKADKQPIGKFGDEKPFSTHKIDLNEGDTIYIFSDGFADQFGGDKGKKFKAANFKKLLLSIQNESLVRQKELINEAFENWRGNLEQLDDVCVIGVRV